MKIKIFDQSFSKFCVLLKEIKENQKKIITEIKY